MTPAVFFDLDGVLADFVRGAFRLHGRSVPLPAVRWGFPAQIGFAGENDPAFWGPMGREFWAGLDPLPDGFALLRAAEQMLPTNRIGLLTSPCDTPGCADGKREWVAKHLPDYRKRLFVGSAKELFAGPGKVLVDDNDGNADRFTAAGGWAVLVPRPWNDAANWCDGEGMFPVYETAAGLRALLTVCAGHCVGPVS